MRLSHSNSLPLRGHTTNSRHNDPPRSVARGVSLMRAESIKKAISTGTASFFGVAGADDDPSQTRRWDERRRRHCSRRYGGLRQPFPETIAEAADGYPTTHIIDPLALGTIRRRYSADGRLKSQTSTRDSVAKIAWSGLATLVRAKTAFAQGAVLRQRQPRQSRSFTPSTVAAENVVFEHELPDATLMRQADHVPLAQISENLPLSMADDEVFFDIRTDETPPPTPLAPALDTVVAKAHDHATRFPPRRGLVMSFFGHFRRSPSIAATIMDDTDDYRPFFTYWITIVQLLIIVFSISVYGIGPIGFSRTQFTAMVLQTHLIPEQVAYFERDNFWIGPRYADLVHLGAKYSACMRRDDSFAAVRLKIVERERRSACCTFHDGTGCVQRVGEECPSSLATFLNWTDEQPGPGNRTSGSVCGQDPRQCLNPASVSPFNWPDDITKWPVCRDSGSIDGTSSMKHMTCEITGRPCCIGIEGECRITTQEYCEFVRGYFHEEATLCSQVHCLRDVCGMVPFANPEKPDQFYRLLLAMFIHAGVFHYLITLLVQYFLMRDLEKLIGWLRMSIIYLVSGIGGSLGSAVFVPYQAEVGPAGAHFGLLAALFVDAIYSWKELKTPWKAIGQLSGVLLLLFVIGLLPYVDNWAHFFGFVFGFLLSLALFPYIQLKSNNGAIIERAVVVCVCLSAVGILLAMLFFLFYVRPLRDCEACMYFNCIPFTEHFCDNQGLTLSVTPI